MLNKIIIKHYVGQRMSACFTSHLSKYSILRLDVVRAPEVLYKQKKGN